MDQTLLNQPWQIQVALASGYAAYLVAFAGIRQNHRAIDVAFSSLVFSVVATGTLAVMTPLGDFFAGLIAVGMTIGFGVAWRKWGRNALRSVLRETRVSWSFDDASALAVLQSNSSFDVTQVAILLEDGTWLRCDETLRFRDCPFGPFTWGPGGDAAIYLTHIRASDGKETVQAHVTDKGWGDQITYVPAAQIRRVTIRHLR